MSTTLFGKSKIRYKVKYSLKRKTTEILVGRTGVQVLTPKKKSQKQIENLIKKHAKWIYKKQLLAKEEKQFKITYKHGSRLPFFGKNYFYIIRIYNF